MSTLTFRAGDATGDLKPGECVIRWETDKHGEYLRLVVCYHSELDLAEGGDGREWVGVAVNPNGTQEGPRLTWALKHEGGGRWQVSPSIRVTTRRPNPDGSSRDIEVWHETPAIVGVPEPPPWVRT